MNYAFLMVFAIIKLSLGELTCNGVELTYLTSNALFVAGVCVSNVTESQMVGATAIIESSLKFECRNGNMYEISYPKRGCVADGTEMETQVVTNSMFGIEVACDLGFCDYIKIRDYKHIFDPPSDACIDYTPDHMEAFTEGVYLNNNECMDLATFSMLVACNGTVASRKFYSNLIDNNVNVDCSGDPTTYEQFTTLGSGKCATSTITSDLVGTHTQEVYYKVICGNAAEAETTTTHTPVSPNDTPSPNATPSPSARDDTNNNHVTMVQCNNLVYFLSVVIVIYFC